MKKFLFIFAVLTATMAQAGTLTVMNNNDDGSSGSLRQTIAAANDGDRIVFDDGITSITLQSELDITDKILTIDGGGKVTLLVAVTGYRHINVTNTNYIDNLFTLENMTITGLGGSSTISGGVSCDGIVTINNCVISNCHNTDNGGGVFSRSTVNLTNCTVSDNSSGSWGGGIFAGGTANLINCIVSGNTASQWGGGILGANGVNLTGCTVSGNSVSSNAASLSGGGIYTDETANLTNCTVANNSVAGNSTSQLVGGGIYAGITANLTCSTVSGNSAGTNGGGIYVVSAPTLLGTIIAGNYTAGTENEISINGAAASNGNGALQSGNMSNVLTAASAYYIVGIPTSGNLSYLLQTVTGSSPLAPLLTDNGGPMQTILPAVHNSYSAGSGAMLNAIPINTTTQAWLPATDQRGISRPATGSCTVGAVEVNGSLPDGSLIVTNANSSGVGSLSKAVAYFNSTTVSGATLPNAVITFDPAFFNTARTITLTQQLNITGPLTITGPGVDLLTIYTATTGYRHFYATSYDPNFTDNLFTLENMTITGLGGSSGVSGGVSCDGIVTINNCVISNCHNIDNGGGVFSRSTVNLTNCTVSDNSSGSWGGGIFAGGTANLTNCIVLGNTASQWGGGILGANGVNLTGCTVSGNSVSSNAASLSGGGIYTDETANLTNCTVANNSVAGSSTSQWGGGIYAGITANLTCSTVSGNSAGTKGGGIYVVSAPTLLGTIIAGNYTAGTENEISINGAAASNGNGALQSGNMSNVLTAASAYYIVGIPTSGNLSYLLQTVTGSSPLAPLLTDNGGPMQTILPAANSAMLDAVPAGMYAATNWNTQFDQRGNYRPTSGKGTVGAVELVIPIASVAVAVAVPATGATPNGTVTAAGNSFTASAASWLPNDNPFLGNTAYTAQITLTAATGHTFTEMTTATVNSHSVTPTFNTDGTVTLSYAFPATGKYATSLSLAASPSVGQTYPGDVALTAQLSGVVPLDGQTITFTVNGSNYTGTTDASGSATYTVSSPIAGNYSFGASYAGDANNDAATAPNIAGYTVGKAAPDMSLTATGGTYSDNNIALTVTVSTVGAGLTPDGSITFKEGATTLVTVPLDDSGTATYVVPSLINPGNHTYTAEYSGNGYYNANSASATVNVAPYLLVSPTTLNFIAAGETKTFTVMCNTYWTIDNGASWLTISQGDDKTMVITAGANPNVDQRFALINIGIPGVISQSVAATQDAADKTAIEAIGTPVATVYSQNGDVIVKSDAPVQSVAVYDVSGKVVKAVNGIESFNGIITINDLPKQQVLIVRVTMSDNSIMNYKLRIMN